VCASPRSLVPTIALLILTLILTIGAATWLEVTTEIAEQLLQPGSYIQAVLGPG